MQEKCSDSLVAWELQSKDLVIIHPIHSSFIMLFYVQI
jgi:hypothetical protein